MMLAKILIGPNKNLVTKNWKNCGTNLIFFVYLCTIYGYKSTFRNYRKEALPAHSRCTAYRDNLP